MVFSNNLLLGAVSAAASDYLIEQSLLFDGSSYLSRIASVAGNRKTWTFSCWFKRDAFTSAATQMLFAGGSVTGANDTNWVQVFINSDGTFGVGGGATTWRVSSAKLADTSAWYHLTVNVDTTQATAADRIKMFLNGVQITSFGTNNAITLNADTGANSVAIHTIGRRDDASRYFNGLMALPILVDGAALDATSFGELDADGYWNPIEYTGSYGTNGGAYDFADSSDFGKDVNTTSSKVPSASGLWSGATGSFTFTADDVSKGVSEVGIYTTTALTGDFVIHFTLASGQNQFRVGIFDTAEVGSYNSADSVGGLNSMTNSWIANYGGTFYQYGSANQASITYITGPATIQRFGSTITMYNGGSSHTFSQTFSGDIHLSLSSNGPFSVTDLYWKDETSGNVGNEFFGSGFVAADQVSDTPTDDADLGIGNHVSFTPLGRFTDITLSEANTVMTVADASIRNCELSIAPESGKFIFEINAGTGNNNGMAFARDTYDRASNANWGNSLDAIRMFRESSTNLRTYYNTGSGVNVNIGVTIDNTNDRIVYAIDADNRYLWLGLWDASASAYIWLDGSGGVTGAPATGTNPTYTLPGTGAIYIAGETLSGQPITLYAAADKWLGSGVTGFVALATQNFPAPTIADGSAYFNTVLYTGNGTAIASGGNPVTGVGFQPDFIWLKDRTSSNYHQLYDVVRGAQNVIYSNDTLAEGNFPEALNSIDSDGFTLGNNTGCNNNTNNYVAWCWKAGGAASSNTDGSITSSVSANTTAGFSIVTTTFDATSAATIGHGLGVAPKFIMGKNRTAADDWACYHESIGASNRVQLNLTGASGASSSWNSTAPTTSVFSVNRASWVVSNPDDFVFYCWAEVEGFSKFGSYTGNGSADGPFVYCGFRPAFVLIKDINSGVDGWAIEDAVRDTYNPVSKLLLANSTSAELTPYNIDFLSNGFKIRTTTAGFNTNTNTMIFAAYAENPFQGDEGYTQARAR
jgi:hypothetical protein